MSVIEARERGRVPEDSDETLHDAENQWLDWTGHVLSVWWPNHRPKCIDESTTIPRFSRLPVHGRGRGIKHNNVSNQALASRAKGHSFMLNIRSWGKEARIGDKSGSNLC
jgi:hypothetical protein